MKTKILQIGDTIEDEYRHFNDSETGASIHQLSNHDSIQHNLFFLTTSFRPKHENQVAYLTHRSGFPQLALFDFRNKSSLILSDHPQLLPFSPAFSKDGAEILFTTSDGEVWSIDIDKKESSMIAKLDGAGLGECSPSSDGQHWVTAIKVKDQHGLWLIDRHHGKHKIIHMGNLKIIHPQFHPQHKTLIEFAGDPAPRLWTIQSDGSELTCLYENSSNEFFVHESFLGNSDELIFSIWPHRLAKINIHDKKIKTISNINAWHMRASEDGKKIVSDTNHPDRGLILIDPNDGSWKTLCSPQSSNQGFQWQKDYPAGAEVWQSIRDGKHETLSWMEMKTDHVYGPQWTHPHPSFNSKGNRVIYTSDVSGAPQVYIVEL